MDVKLVFLLVCIIIVQNASTANMMHFDYQLCIDVTGTAYWILFQHSQVCISLVQNATSAKLTVNRIVVLLYSKQYCKLDLKFVLKEIALTSSFITIFDFFFQFFGHFIPFSNRK